MKIHPHIFRIWLGCLLLLTCGTAAYAQSTYPVQVYTQLMPPCSGFFSWTPRHLNSPAAAYGTEYELSLVEIYDRTTPAENAFLYSVVNGGGKIALLSKLKDFTNLRTWVNTLDNAIDAKLLSKLNDLPNDYLALLNTDIAHVRYGTEIQILLKESPDDLTDVWKTLKVDPAYSWELSKEDGSRWEKWAQREFFIDVTGKGIFLKQPYA